MLGEIHKENVANASPPLIAVFIPAYVSFFLIASLMLVFLGGIWGTVKWLEPDLSEVFTTTGIVFIAVPSIIQAMQFLLETIALDTSSVSVEPLVRRMPKKPSMKGPLMMWLHERIERGGVRVPLSPVLHPV